MSFLKNRTVLGVICIILSLIICFALTPLFNSGASAKTQIVRVVQYIRAGEMITKDSVRTVEVGAYNLPDNVMKNAGVVIGKYATADLAVGDYIVNVKLSDNQATENTYLYNLTGEKQAISVTVRSLAAGLSGKLTSGDIVSVIVPDFRKQGVTVVPSILQYVEIIAVTAGNGNDANTPNNTDNEKRELPSTVTLLALPEQAKLLAELEAEGKLHLALVYRGTSEDAALFIEIQDKIIDELNKEDEPDNGNNHNPQNPHNNGED